MIGIRCKDGVVFASENMVHSKLHEPNTVKHVFTVDAKLGVVSHCSHVSSSVGVSLSVSCTLLLICSQNIALTINFL